MELLFVYIYCLLSLFTLIRGHILRLEMPKEVGELREIDQESTFCASFSLPSYPIYVTKIEPFVTEDTNHLTLVGLEKGHKGQNLTKCRTLKANSSNSWQMGGKERTDTLFVTSGEKKGVVPYDQAPFSGLIC